MSKDKNPWTLRDQHAAYAQGWGLFAPNGNRSRLRIERIDDPRSLEDIVGLAEEAWNRDDPYFGSDTAAQLHVLRQFRALSPLAAAAMAHIEEHHPEEVGYLLTIERKAAEGRL